MRTVKLLAVVLVLALTGIVYAAGASQDAAKTPETGKASQSCCRKHATPQAAATEAGKKLDGEGCCAGGSCAMKLEGAQAGTPKAAAGGEKAGCCAAGGSSCCASGSCADGHDKAAGTQDAARGVEGCCKAHKSDAKQAASSRSSGAQPEAAASTCGGSCCGGKAVRKTQAAGR